MIEKLGEGSFGEVWLALRLDRIIIARSSEIEQKEN
jgi:serine/threonine protein kinase